MNSHEGAWEGDPDEFEIELVLKNLGWAPKGSSMGRSPLAENVLEPAGLEQWRGPVRGFPSCLSSSFRKSCYKDMDIFVYENDCIIIKSRVMPSHFADGDH